MKKIRLAMIGCGFLNEIVANALQEGVLPNYELVAVLGRDFARTKEFAARHNCKPCANIQELMNEKPDYTAEAASVWAVKEYTQTVLEGGSNLVVLSIGAFADDEFYQQVQKTASAANRKVHIASGAVGGFDILRTAALMGPASASFHSKKSIPSLLGSPLFTNDLPFISEPKQVFSGTAKQAIAMLPTHFNVAVATALASTGTDDMKMEIDAVPGFVGDEYTISIQSPQVKAEFNIYSRTSAIAAFSVIAVLQNVASPIVF